MRIAILLLFSVFQLFSQNKQNFSLESVSKFNIEWEDNNYSTTFVNSNFLEFYVDSKYCIISEKITKEAVGGGEGSHGLLEATAYYSVFDSPIKKMWQIYEPAHNSFFFYDFYVAKHKGCCDAHDTNAYFNLKSGKKIFSATSDVLVVNYSNDRNVYISYIFITSSKDFPVQYPYLSNVKGIITLATSEEVLSRLLISTESDMSDYDYYPDDFYLTNSQNKNRIEIDKLYENKTCISDVDFYFDYWGTDVYFTIEKGKIVIKNITDLDLFSFSSLDGSEKDSYLFDPVFLNLSYHSKDELRLLRNTIFAHNGHSFNSPDLREHFNSTPWYKEIPGHKVSDSELTENEKNVLNRIEYLEEMD